MDFAPSIDSNTSPGWELQTQNDTCAPVSETSIINLFGHDLTQDDAAYISASHGWYIPGIGTAPPYVGNMMDSYDIPNHSVPDATISDLAQDLRVGHGVVLRSASETSWTNGELGRLWSSIKAAFALDATLAAPADHSIVVTGIDASAPGASQIIIINASGDKGETCLYPMDKFMAAWAATAFSYTATDNAMPGTDAGELGSVDFSRWLGDAPWLDNAGALELDADFLASLGIGSKRVTLIETLFETPDIIDQI